MQATDAAHECYARLVAARRDVTPAEFAEMEAESKREQLAMRMRRRLPKVY